MASRIVALASLILFGAACGGGSKVRRPDWVTNGSGTVDDQGKWYYGVEKVVSAGGKLARRKSADQKAKESAAAACKDVKPDDAEIIDHYVDESGAEYAVARVDAAKCPDAKEAGAKEEKPAAKEEKAEEKPAEEKPAEEKPAE